MDQRKPNLNVSFSECGASLEYADIATNVPTVNEDATQFEKQLSTTSKDSQEEITTNEVTPKVSGQNSKETGPDQISKKKCRFCKKADAPDKMIEPCECKNANQWIHLDCFARHLETTKEFSKCNFCKTDYKTNRFRLIKMPMSFFDFFTQSRSNFAYLVEVPLSLGFVFLLLALGLIQYEQSYKIIYLKWSIILVFLILLIVLNHVALFFTNIYQLAVRVRRFQTTNFRIVVEAKSDRPAGHASENA